MPAGPIDDPWNYWVFRVTVGGSANGERRQQGVSVNGSFSASRVTEELTITLRSFARYSRSEFELDSSNTFVSTVRDLGTDGLLALSLGNHWSRGVLAAVRSSTRLNQDLALEAGPAVEFNIFPISRVHPEATDCKVFSYTFGSRFNNVVNPRMSGGGQEVVIYFF